MEEKTFKFRVSLGYTEEIELWIEIPIELYQRICDSVGRNKMERYEFCFNFSQHVKERFPELDTLIIQQIDKWKSEHYGLDWPDNVLHLYGLTSTWFPEEE